mgnify:CR=1 FL=1
MLAPAGSWQVTVVCWNPEPVAGQLAPPIVMVDSAELPRLVPVMTIDAPPAVSAVRGCTSVIVGGEYAKFVELLEIGRAHV